MFEPACIVCNCTASIQKIQGYGGEKDEFNLYNYTVGKTTIDCNFELDTHLYNCIALEVSELLYPFYISLWIISLDSNIEKCQKTELV